MADARIDHEDYTHPEKLYKNLLLVSGRVSEEDQVKRAGLIDMFSRSRFEDFTKKTLCWSCGWTAEDEMYSSYGSRIRIHHTHGNIGIWEIGSRWMIRDQPNDLSVGNDTMTQEFLRRQPGMTIPILKEMTILSAPTDKVLLTLMTRAQGVRLDTIWNTLSTEQKANYRTQFKSCLEQLQQYTSPIAQKVDGNILDDHLIGYCRHRTSPTCKKLGRTTEEWFGNLETELRHGLSNIHKTKDPVLIDAKFQELKDNFPKPEPYVLTHSDLNLTNIIVKDDQIEAIIDWEFAGYYPWWVERYMCWKGMTNQTNDLFTPIWNEIGMSDDSFANEVWGPVEAVNSAWHQGNTYPHIEHPDSGKAWLRPGFCECQPYTGKFNWDLIGGKVDHQVRDPSTPARTIFG
ncbi:hypothetical protein BKA61DRAFT_584088 [Leptodontidium sp. MPI-SDFR-AT-0119]|nr:hypothetical protein BKA61DRAFT_584088 [Leptodontidium sp. MPI-SDFR-AT-0119]